MEINNSLQLKAAIKQLESQEKMRRGKLIGNFHVAYESMKPINILKRSLSNVVESPTAVESIINTAAGLGTGLLSKTLVGKSTGILKKLLVTGVELGMVNLVSKNAESIKLGALNVIGKIFKSKRT
jgi:hypothetical protein